MNAYQQGCREALVRFKVATDEPNTGDTVGRWFGRAVGTAGAAAGAQHLLGRTSIHPRSILGLLGTAGAGMAGFAGGGRLGEAVGHQLGKEEPVPVGKLPPKKRDEGFDEMLPYIYDMTTNGAP
jgi:hypothetical protein